MYKVTDENHEEYEGVTINVKTNDWPVGLVGVIVKEQIAYADNGILKIVGDPIWKFGEEHDV
jgi:hypothetical protein